jgi:F-type H+-transporting ATPase subunit b
MTFNIWTFLFEAVNFLVLAYILHRLLYRPLRDAIERRRMAHEHAEAEAHEKRQKADALLQQLKTQLADVDRVRQETIRQAHEQALAERNKILDEASAAVQARQEAARTALAREREETLRAVHEEIINQAMELSRRLLHEAADLTLEEQLAKRLAETLELLPEADRQALRRDWNPQAGATLEAARAIDGPALERLSTAVAAIVGQPADVVIEPRTSLIAGFRLRLGGRVWDASLDGQLKDLETPSERRADRV